MHPLQPISEADISRLIDAFYIRVRGDATIGPIFDQAVEDWPAHLALLKNFWSTVLLTTGVYRGDPLPAHLKLPLEREHFERWLALFAETANDLLSRAERRSEGEAWVARSCVFCMSGLVGFISGRGITETLYPLMTKQLS